jgi:hypothetical protein
VIQSAAPAHGQNGTRRVILAEPVGAVDGEELREPRARAIDPALDRAYRALADRSRLLVGETRRADEKQSLALAGRQLRERHTKFLEFNPARLLRRRRKISVSAGKSSTVCCEAEGAKRLAWRTRHFSKGEQFDTDAIGGSAHISNGAE